MRKFLSTIAILGLTTGLSQAQILIGPEAGASLYTMSQKFNGTDRSNNQQLGFRGGVSLDIPFKPWFSIQPGAFFTSNIGSRGNYSRNYATGGGVSARIQDDREYHINQIQIPVYAVFKSGQEFDDIHFFIGAGPYVAFNIGGHYYQKTTQTVNGLNYSQLIDEGINLGNDGLHDNVRVFDIGANVTGGVMFPFGGFIRAYYGIGFLNLKPQGDGQNSFRTIGGGLTFGYFFNPGNKTSWEY